MVYGDQTPIPRGAVAELFERPNRRRSRRLPIPVCPVRSLRLESPEPGRAGGWRASDRQAWLFLDDSRFGSQDVGVEQEGQPDEHWDQSEEENRTVRQDRNQKYADSDTRRR